ncbi:RNA polymerase sigma factor [Microbacterium sp. YJN-G]|uniref:RNA polymerase sigma factor n=1 Tax=Microbacterium sp. YJN-G TaxID=2763257 RepID=UPI001D0C9016|nr:sigma-70 family RNA polymerase sigma factor [Microbacterium sp. YJN-G]
MSEATPDGSAEQTPARSRWQRAADLFRAWRDGDARAMDDLVRLMTPVLWHVVRAAGIDRALTEDVIQTTWLRLVRTGDAISEPAAVAAWLTTTARREAWRTSGAQRRADAVDDTSLEPLLPVAPSAEDTAVAGDQRNRLWSAVQRLDDRCQRLLRVVAFDDRPDYARLAGELAMPVGSIGPTRKRCLTKLRGLLEEVAT